MNESEASRESARRYRTVVEGLEKIIDDPRESNERKDAAFKHLFSLTKNAIQSTQVPSTHSLYTSDNFSGERHALSRDLNRDQDKLYGVKSDDDNWD